MAVKRSTNAEDYQRVARPVAAMPKDFPHGHHIAPHSHERGQVIYATTGVMRVSTTQGTWVVPPQRALWIPPGVAHEIRMSGAVAMRTLYIAADTAASLPPACRVIEVSDLLRALILAAMEEPVDYAAGSRGEAIAQLLLHELRGVAVVPLHLPLPQDARLQTICRRMQENLRAELDIETLAHDAGMSSRSLARLFQRETGLGFQAWRQQARLAEALAQLSSGKPVAVVARDLGYASPAAFTAMFRRSLRTTPGRYFSK
ncbi:MAG: helix-turn-helix transcriptional regulator [Ferrovibrio sp.]|uniref:AraC family transcriptional regulator n=1 Tax=Ferrovibrio sp. TaxID=1917215 RepID=UPI0026073EB8|nr:helix-turn-helix transcriptional regulator [Ferrovibrio sp.]MCW0233634.1 helix-turn-helix transcriptional regulator [Ferrovibrio sp.]